MTNQPTHFLSHDEVLEDMVARRRERTKARDAKRDAVMRLIFSKPGFAMVVAKQLGLTHQSVSQWNRVPPHHATEVASLLDMSPEQVRPDIFKRGRRT
jgi:hypothetical protein